MKNCKKEQKPWKNQCFLEKKGRKTNFGPRIRAVHFTYSSGEVMRNPYRQAVQGILETSKKFLETSKKF